MTEILSSVILKDYLSQCQELVDLMVIGRTDVRVGEDYVRVEASGVKGSPELLIDLTFSREINGFTARAQTRVSSVYMDAVEAAEMAQVLASFAAIAQAVHRKFTCTCKVVI